MRKKEEKKSKNKITVIIGIILAVIALTAGTIAVINNKNNSGNEENEEVMKAAKNVAVKSISFDKTNIEIKRGYFVELIPIFNPSNATNKKITWTSSNTKVATVDAKGIVKGVSEGKTTITAKTANGKKATCTVKVVLGGIPIKTSKATVNTYPFGIEYIEVTNGVVPEAPKTITWTSSDASVAVVHAVTLPRPKDVRGVDYHNAMVIGLKEGKTTITAKTEHGYEVKFTVNVSKKNQNATGLKKVEIDPSASFKKNETTVLVSRTLDLKNELVSGAVGDLAGSVVKKEWKSSNTKVATVDANGIVKGLAEGTTIITYKMEAGTIGVTTSITINVKKGTIVPNKTPVTCKAGEKVTITMSGTSKVKDYLPKDDNIAGITKKDDTHFIVLCKKAGKSEIYFSSPEQGYLILPVTVK